MPRPQFVPSGEMSRQGILELLLDLEWGECVRVLAPVRRVSNVTGLFHFGSYAACSIPEHKDKRFHVFGFEGNTWMLRCR